MVYRQSQKECWWLEAWERLPWSLVEPLPLFPLSLLCSQVCFCLFSCRLRFQLETSDTCTNIFITICFGSLPFCRFGEQQLLVLLRFLLHAWRLRIYFFAMDDFGDSCSLHARAARWEGICLTLAYVFVRRGGGISRADEMDKVTTIQQPLNPIQWTPINQMALVRKHLNPPSVVDPVLDSCLRMREVYVEHDPIGHWNTPKESRYEQ